MRALATRSSVAAALLFAAGSSMAQYKVTGPDGRVTYTDRPPATAPGDRVLPLGNAGNAPSAVVLPLELRQAASRYPVTLYVSANCEPCDAGRLLLRQRGIPYDERQMITADDSDALQRLTGARTVPALTIGQQAVNGLSPQAWQTYLDAAGYPRQSRLPAGYVFAAPTPLVERLEPRPVAPVLRPAAPTASPVPAPDIPPSSIRF